MGTGLGGFGRRTNVERIGIPGAYATELQTVIDALGHMKQPPDLVRWLNSGTPAMGVPISDTMMFQRADPHPSDANLGAFYGLAMPLVKRGLPAEPVQIESATEPGFLSRYRLLLLTYEGQKPPTAEFHDALAKWVRAGGALVVVDETATHIMQYATGGTDRRSTTRRRASICSRKWACKKMQPECIA